MWWGGRSLHGDTVWGYRDCLCIPHPYPPLVFQNSGSVGWFLGLWYGGRMSADILKDMVALIETWPVAAQEELAGIAQAMDAAMKGGVYHATPEELAGIDRGLASARAGRFATDDQVAALFEKYRPGGADSGRIS